MRTSADDGFIKGKIATALANAGVAPDHPIGALLDSGATIVATPRDFYVRVNGRSLDDQIQILKKNPKFFAQPSASVDHRDLNKTREAFQDIVSGKTVVT